MTEDETPTETPDEAEARLRRHWPGRTWRRSHEGNFYLNSDGYNVVLYNRSDGWRITIENRETGLHRHGREIFATLNAAKAAAFDALMWARRHT